MAMKPPPVRPTGGRGTVGVTSAPVARPKPSFAGKKPLRVTGGNSVPQTAGTRSGVGRLAKAGAGLLAQRRITDKRDMK